MSEPARLPHEIHPDTADAPPALQVVDPEPGGRRPRQLIGAILALVYGVAMLAQLGLHVAGIRELDGLAYAVIPAAIGAVFIELGVRVLRGWLRGDSTPVIPGAALGLLLLMIALAAVAAVAMGTSASGDPATRGSATAPTAPTAGDTFADVSVAPVAPGQLPVQALDGWTSRPVRGGTPGIQFSRNGDALALTAYDYVGTDPATTSDLTGFLDQVTAGMGTAMQAGFTTRDVQVSERAGTWTTTASIAKTGDTGFAGRVGAVVDANEDTIYVVMSIPQTGAATANGDRGFDALMSELGGAAG